MQQRKTLTWSYGGGTQSIAIAVLIAQGRLPKPECIVMADTGREATEVWEYHERYVAPLLASVGIAIEIASHSLATVDMYAHNGDLLVPAFTASGKLRTFCSDEWKKNVFRRYLRSKGYGPVRPVITWLGFSLDELSRLKHSDVQWSEYHWPLCYDVPMTRSECAAHERRALGADPPKSSCYICPHRKNVQWRRLRDHYPADWQKAIKTDYFIREQDVQHAVYLHRDRVPLDQADLGTEEEEPPMFGCESGMCFV